MNCLLISTVVVLALISACSSPQPDSASNGDGRADGDPAPDDACPVIDSRNWGAWINAMPGPDKPRLHVMGEIDLPSPGYTIQWRLGPADRANPPGQFLDLVLTPPEGPVAQVVTAVEVRYDGEAVYPAYRVIRVRCVGAPLAEITEVTVAH